MFIPIISPIWKALKDRRTRIAGINANSFHARLGNQSISEWVESKLDEPAEKRIQLWENPPPCGSVIRYSQKYSKEVTYGEFLFQTMDVRQHLKVFPKPSTYCVYDDEGAIRNWIRGCDELLAEPTDVTSTWERFYFVANALVREGKAVIYCQKCQANIDQDQITTKDDKMKNGWNFDRVVCPNGHNLLSVPMRHMLIRYD